MQDSLLCYFHGSLPHRSDAVSPSSYRKNMAWVYIRHRGVLERCLGSMGSFVQMNRETRWNQKRTGFFLCNRLRLFDYICNICISREWKRRVLLKKNQNSSVGEAVSSVAQEPYNINLCASLNCASDFEIMEMCPTAEAKERGWELPYSEHSQIG